MATSPSKGITVQHFDDLSGIVGQHTRAPYRRSMSADVATRITDLLTSTNSRSLLSVGQRLKELYYADLDIDDEDAHLNWQFKRFMGHGSFGVAALFEKLLYNVGTGEWDKVDELVVKTEQPEKAGWVNHDHPQISAEAYNLAQLNERQCRSTVLLRNFKYHQGFTSVADHTFFNEPYDDPDAFGHPPLHREWRYYLEYCSLDTIYHLYLKYKAWGYHLPEIFIWWTLHGLVESCVAMHINEKQAFRSTESQDFGRLLPRTYMLHNDMSWRNVFVQKPDDQSLLGPPFTHFPIVKMADFGLANTTQIDSIGSSCYSLATGTRAFLPPERMEVLEHVRFYPFERFNEIFDNANILYKARHHVGPEANLWGVGLIIYLLMTLADLDDICDEIELELNDRDDIRDSWERHRDRRRSSGGLYVFDKILTAFDEDSPLNYSESLRTLVLECTRIQPEKRPDLDMLRLRIQNGIIHESRRLHNQFGSDPERLLQETRVVTDHEQWNQTVRGPFDFGVGLRPAQPPPQSKKIFWEEFETYCNQNKDADTPRLIPPEPCSVWIKISPANQAISAYDSVYYCDATNKHLYHNGRNQVPMGGRAWDAGFLAAP